VIFLQIYEWFSINSLMLNLNKTNCGYFTTKLNLLKNMNITHRDTLVTASVAQWSELLAADPEVPGLIPSTTTFSE
jgi:hypothetical protein